MAKRANPFTEDYIPQSKIHKSLKQFNNNEDRLQKVYVKTLDLLFKGAKKCQSHDIVNSNDSYTTMKTTEKNNKMKQLFIGKNGKLHHRGSMECNNNKCSKKQCSCGRESESQCAYCELSLCLSCQLPCARCERSHCVACTLTGFEGSEVCVSCYS